MDMLQDKILFQVKICQPRLIVSFLSCLLILIHEYSGIGDKGDRESTLVKKF